MENMRPGRSTPGRAEAPDQAAKLEALHKKLLSEMKALQAAQLKTLRDDMRKESKRTEAATQAQVSHAISACPVTRHHNSKPAWLSSLTGYGWEETSECAPLTETMLCLHFAAHPR